MHKFIECVEGVRMSCISIILFPIKLEKEKKKECPPTLRCTFSDKHKELTFAFFPPLIFHPFLSP